MLRVEAVALENWKKVVPAKVTWVLGRSLERRMELLPGTVISWRVMAVQEATAVGMSVKAVTVVLHAVVVGAEVLEVGFVVVVGVVADVEEMLGVLEGVLEGARVTVTVEAGAVTVEAGAVTLDEGQIRSSQILVPQEYSRRSSDSNSGGRNGSRGRLSDSNGRRRSSNTISGIRDDQT